MKTRLIRRLLGVFAVSALTVSLGQASAFYLTTQTVSFGTLGPSQSTTVFFNSFDYSAYSDPTHLAVLSSVEIGVAGSATGSVKIVNANEGAAFSTVPVSGAYTQLPVTLNASGVVNYAVLAVANTCGSFTTPNPGSCVNTLGGGVGGVAYQATTPGLDPYGVLGNIANTVSNVSGTVTGQAFVNPLLYSSYSTNGPSLNSIGVAMATGLTASGGNGPGAMLWGGTATTTGTVSITYGYDLVAAPEPMTMALTGSAMIGLAVLIRRRKRA